MRRRSDYSSKKDLTVVKKMRRRLYYSSEKGQIAVKNTVRAVDLTILHKNKKYPTGIKNIRRRPDCSSEKDLTDVKSIRRRPDYS